MSVKYKDYYKTLNVDRKADGDEIQKAFRKLARKYHPDVNKDPGAEDKFKELNEAYEVLKDPVKRDKYDNLGASWQSGDPFEGFRGFRGGGGGNPFSGFGGGQKQSGFEGNDFSDFFETLFGGAGFSDQGGGFSPFGNPGRPPPQKGEDLEVEITINLADAYHGATRNLNLASGNGQKKSYQIKIPAGATEGMKIRLSGQGKVGMNGVPNGDLFLKVKLEKHPLFTVEGKNISTSVDIAPWEAALGAKIEVPTLDGMVTMTVPAGAQTGQKMRLKGKGFPHKAARGDLYVHLNLVMPKHLSETEKKLFEKLAKASHFNPRNESRSE
jgi:curved DNA-binding protein